MRPPPPPAPPGRTRVRAASLSACVPRGMPGARSGGSGGDDSSSGGYSGDASGAVTVWEVVSLLGKLLGTVAALKVVLYLLRVCLAMAWKSGGASHSELIHNLRSKCHPRPVWGNWGRPGLNRIPWAVRNVPYTPVPAGGLRRTVAPAVPNGKLWRLPPPGPVTHRRRAQEPERKPGAAASGAGAGVSPRAWGRGRGTGGGAVTRVRHLPVRVRRARGVPWGVGCWPGLVETGLEVRGPRPRPPRLLTSSSVISVDLAASFLPGSASPALRFFLWREMPPSDTGEGREREMKVMSLRMLGEISGAAVQWKASWGAEEEITRRCSSGGTAYFRSL